MKLMTIFASMLLGHACVSNSTNIESLYLEAQHHYQKGNTQAAITSFQKILSLNPKHFDAYFHLGNTFFQQGNYDQAAFYYKKAAQINQSSSQVQYNLGLTYKKLNKPLMAIGHLECTVGLSANHIDAHQQLVALYKTEKQPLHAIFHLKQIIKEQPQLADMHYELGMLLKDAEQFNESIKHLTKATELEPNNYTFLFHLAGALLSIGKIDKAVDAYKKVLSINPDATSALYNTGYALKTAGRLDEAIKIYNQVLEKDPNHDATRLALGFAYLQSGNYQTGWEKHTWYLKRSGKNADALRKLIEESDNLLGKKILFKPEGGIGDTINFLRYALILKKMGATVIVLVQPPLIPLISQCPYIDQLIVNRDQIPAHDAASSFMTLPAVFYSDEHTIPQDIPYIFPDQELVKFWHEKLKNDTNFKIGIAWQADVHNDSSRLPIARRGIPLSQMFCLKNIPGISLYSLQKKEGLEQLSNIPDDFKLHIFNPLDEDAGPFMDTVAIMQNLDLIITIDSAVAHLAGALGKPVWLLLPYATDWRWLAGRSDSPWYPTMRIFKQPTPFDWHYVIKEVSQALQEITR